MADGLLANSTRSLQLTKTSRVREMLSNIKEKNQSALRIVVSKDFNSYKSEWKCWNASLSNPNLISYREMLSNIKKKTSVLYE